MPGYRERIFAEYASTFQDAHSVFEPDAATRWGKAYDHYFRQWLPKKKDAAIVDLACGGGNLLYFFKHRGYTRVSGVDVSLSQVQLAKQVLPDVTETNILDYLEVHPAAFDLITGLDIIEHFHKDEVLRFLDACYNALKPGGRLILQTPNAESPWGTMHRYNDLTHEVCFNPNALERLVRLCGFTKVAPREQGPVPWGYSLQSTLRYLAWQTIRLGLKLWNVAETGDSGSGVFTRVFIISALKK